MERFSFKSGRAMQVAKLIKEDWPIVLQLEFQLYTTFKSFITKVLKVNRRIKFVCIAMCSLVMSLCSCDLLMTSLRTITIH